ncbi:MAG: universal stress protein [Candidatus Eremiobacteraeota bacterium]|nr:universal stress protein [Candidatus Eremiobacteraeota bacterium]
MLVAVDGSGPSDAAVRLSLQIGSGPEGALRFVSVFDPHDVGALAAAQQACRDALDDACRSAREGSAGASATMRTGNPVDEILAEADGWNATCVVVGTHARSGLPHAFFGSCAEGVLRYSARPVLVARDGVAPRSGTFERVLCAYDGSAAARRAFEAVAAFAAARRIEVHLLSVVQLDNLYATGYERDGFDPDGSIRSIYDEARRALKVLAAGPASSGVCVALHVGGGADVAAVIGASAAAYRCGLIAMGTHGRRGITRALLGSTAESVIRGGAAPVLALHERVAVPMPSLVPDVKNAAFTELSQR